MVGISHRAADDRLKVLNLVDSLGQGGLENGVVHLASLLGARGVDYPVAVLRGGGVFEKRITSEVVDLQKGGGVSLGAVRRLRQQIRERRPDVLHCRNLGPLIYAVLATLGMGKSRPMVMHSEHAQFRGDELTPKRMRQRRILYRFVEALMCLSYDQRHELQRLELADESEVAVIANGVDTHKFTPLCDRDARAQRRGELGLPNDAMVLGVVGRFGRLKNHRRLIAAFEAAADRMPNVVLAIAGGSGECTDAVRAQVEASPVRGRVIMLGHRDDMPDVYPVFDVLVSASENEGMSNAMLEAMSCGVPVAAYPCAGVEQIIGSEKNGWIVDATTPEAWAEFFVSDALQSFVAKGEAARARIESSFSLEVMADAYLSWYRDELGKGGRS